MLNNSPINIFWFRRDLRLEDNHGLYRALNTGVPVLCIFIFDTNLLSRMENPADRRISFIYQQIKNLKAALEREGSSMVVLNDKPEPAFQKLLKCYPVSAVFCNEEYEPEAIERDIAIKNLLLKNNVAFHQFKDHVIFSGGELNKPNGDPYTIFTPYSKKWFSKLETDVTALQNFSTEKLRTNFYRVSIPELRTLKEMGFEEVDPRVQPIDLSTDILRDYGTDRDKLYVKGTSHAGVHLRFGTVSIRNLVRKAFNHPSFLSELAWRDFFQSILYHFPRIAAGGSFKPSYDNIKWRNNEIEFKKWCEGRTGYPVVDAGMRELLATGFMHNRARMITASFLCKHLLIDWRWGEAWFAEHLLDYDFASNNGNWQWAAGSGCDATPYFRIFNPYTQQKKFDPNFTYIKTWVTEFGTGDYPFPIVEHEFARKRCLEVYREALQNENPRQRS